MRPLTDRRPKPLLSVGDRSLLEQVFAAARDVSDDHDRVMTEVVSGIDHSDLPTAQVTKYFHVVPEPPLRASDMSSTTPEGLYSPVKSFFTLYRE